MFGFFVNHEFKGFWSNQPGDIFFDLTCLKMQWPKEATTLVYFPGLLESELKDALATPDKCQGFKSELQEIGQDEEGNTLTEEVKILNREIVADKFVINGIIIIPC
jgi:hypothetical protein